MSEKILSFDETFKELNKEKNRFPYETLLRGMIDQSCLITELADYLESLGLLNDFYMKCKGTEKRIVALREAIKVKR